MKRQSVLLYFAPMNESDFSPEFEGDREPLREIVCYEALFAAVRRVAQNSKHLKAALRKRAVDAAYQGR